MSDFKVGDIVYYISDDIGFLKKNTPYEVSNVNFKMIGIKIKSGQVTMTVSYNSDKFISESEYKKKQALSNNDKVFKTGDIVYYIGNNLKKDIPYTVLFVKFEGILYGRKIYKLTIKDINGRLFDGFDTKDFISKEEYDGNKEDSHVKEFNKHSIRDDYEIRMRIYNDTKSGSLKWTRPYRNYEDWFRAELKLKNPIHAYLRFDIRFVSNEWELNIYYHRNKVDTPILIKRITQTNTLLTIVKKIENSLFVD